MLDGQIGNAAAGIDAMGTVERLRRAGVETAAAGAAVVAGMRGLVRRQLDARQDHTEEQPAAMLAADDIGMFALPAEASRLGQRLFELRRGIAEHLEIAASLRGQPAAERFQRLLDRLVIVAALRIDRAAAMVRLLRKRARIVL